ncbi:DEAD/DEAH box helicase, partial [archaeon]
MVFKTLHPRVKALSEERFEAATAVQEKAFAPILGGKNTLVIAPTGIGKTEAALLPIFSLMLREKEKIGKSAPKAGGMPAAKPAASPQKGPRAPGISVIYITPLKALNRDLLSRIEWWAEHLDIHAEVRHGDTTPYQRSKQAKNPPELLITTPETLQSILPAKRMGQHLTSVRHVVVDEIHELVESKRGTQLSIALERLVERAGEFQRIGLSATVGSPKITSSFLVGARGVETVDVSMARPLDLSVELPSATKKDKSLINTLHMRPSTIARLRRLHALVDAHKAVLSFVNTRSMAELLTSRYAAWDVHNKIQVHHSSLSKDVRLVAEQSFKDGSIKGLISTSSLELG